ncbi:MAG TPA: hypothetical protein PKI21_03215 [Nitrospira sp.]|jgi:hypothetical protein|nr:hypothetical protein [Nitrospira sp.]HPV82290.1 hypothetical protein [Nitrospira sp.]
MGDTGSLIIRLKMDASNMEKELNRAARNTDDFGKLVSNAAKIGTVALGALTAVAATTGAALISMTKSSALVGDEINKASQKTGVAVETLSGLRFAADLSDVSMDQLTASMGKLARAQQDAATGSTQARTTFQALGVTYKEADGTLRPLNDVMLDAADQLAHMEDETKRAALAQEVFGKSGMQMLPLLNQGSAAIRAQMEEAKALGVVWTTDAAQGAEAFNDSLTRLGFAAEGFKNDIAQVLIPILTEVTDGVLSWVKANREWIKDEIQKDVRALVTAATDLLSIMSSIAKASIDIKNSSFVDYLLLGLKALGYVVVSTFTVMIGMLEQFALNITKLGAQLPDMLGGKIFQEHAKTLEEMLAKNQHQLKLYTEQIAMDFGLMSKNSTGPIDVVTKKVEQAVAAVKRAGHALKAFPTVNGPQQDAQAIDFYNAEREAALGKLILEQSLEQYRQTLAEGKAQEALGGIVNARFKNEQDLAKQTSALQHTLWLEHMTDGRKQIELIEEEAATRARFIKDNVSDEIERASLLESVERTKTMKLSAIKIEEQKREIEMFEEIRQAAMTGEDAQRYEIERTAEARRRQVMETIKDAQLQAMAIENIEIAKTNKLNALGVQHKSFFTEQMDAIRQSAAFTWSSIVQSFSQAIVGMLQGTKTFADFLQSVWTTILTSFVNMAVQATLAFILEQGKQLIFGQTAASAQAAQHAATESAKTAATVAGETARLGIVMATNKAISAGVIGALSGIAAVGNAAMATMQIVVSMVSSIMAGIGAALVAGVFTAPIGATMLAAAGTLLATGTAAVAVGVGSLQAALGTSIGVATAALATPFADGGIMTGPTIGKFAEAGSPEAAIPLNDRGAKFMQSAMGFGGSGTQQINLYVDGRLMAKQLVRHMPDVIHTKLGYT